MAKYKVLGIEGEDVEINGEVFPGGVGHEIELSEEEAATPLAESKIELVAESEATEPSEPAPEEAPAEETPSEEAPSEEAPQV